MEKFANKYLNYLNIDKLPYPKNLILWPVWIWHVLAPKGNRPLNIFQKTILSLYKTNFTDHDKIAELLGIEKDLLLYIIANELIAYNYLNSRGKITPKGIDKLDRTNEQMHAGYIFQDVFTSNLWPRVVTELSYIEPVQNDNEYVSFRFKRDKDKKERPFIINTFRKIKEKQPEINDLKECIRLANIEIHNLKVRDELEMDMPENYFDEVEMLDTKSTKAYIMLCILKDKEHQWAVSDPSGLTRSVEWLRESVFSRAKDDRNFARSIENFVGDINENETWKEREQRIETKAIFQLMSEFPGIDQIENLAKFMEPLLRIREEINSDKRKTEKYETLIIQAQKIIECCFKWMLSKWPHNNNKKIKKNWKDDELKIAFRSAASFLNESQLEDIKTIRAGKIYWAANKHDESLRPLLAAVLLSLPEHDNHPMHKLSKDNNSISELLKVPMLRNKAAHASNQDIDSQEIINCADFLVQWVKQLLINME